MDKFQMATLARWGGEAGLQGRKRLQKTVYMLQAAGCPLNADFVLHHYGPYSREVAALCDEMTAERLLTEEIDTGTGVRQYNYKIPPATLDLVDRTIAAAPQRLAAIEKYEELAKELLVCDLWRIELGSTILFFWSKLPNWEDAVKQACAFKKATENYPTTNAAVELAKRIATWPKAA